MLQEHRLSQYERLTDVVYEEKGYDMNSIPLEDTLHRLGMAAPEYLSIVQEARQRNEG